MAEPRSDRVNDILQELILSEEEAILTGWVIAFEMITVEGKPYSGFFVSPDTSPWKAFGLLEWAKSLLKSRHIYSSD